MGQQDSALENLVSIEDLMVQKDNIKTNIAPLGVKFSRGLLDIGFYRNKKIFITGHTGFKGSWLAYILAKAGASVFGYALEPPTEPNLYTIAGINELVFSEFGDVRDFNRLRSALKNARPDIVFHLAAQPLVIDGYSKPRYTYEVNVMGTVNLLEAIRETDSVRSVLNVTTDKVYKNFERNSYCYVESDPLEGYDPYSSSKSCSELVTASYRNSFLNDLGIAVSTVRAGNVIGGGDFASNRIIPDCIRAVQCNKNLIVRNPHSIRPYQHVLDPLFAYLIIAEEQISDFSLASSYNVGPDAEDCVSTGDLVKLFSDSWGEGFHWTCSCSHETAPHEAEYLRLCSSKMKTAFDWHPRWHIGNAVDATVEWAKAFLGDDDTTAIMDSQIEYFVV